MGKITRPARFVTLRESGFYCDPRRLKITVDNEDTVFISKGSRVNFGEDVHLGPNTFLSGNIRIGSGSYIVDSWIINSEIGDDSCIGPKSCIENCIIGPNANIGFTAQLKRAVIGKNFTAKHHCYVGDTSAGNGINIGAGFITANYDGVDKHGTIIGDNVFLGTNVNVIAPIEIGKESMIAAGSTVTGNIPPYCVVIARAREQRLEKYFQRKTGKGYEKIKIGEARYRLLKTVFSSLELNSEKHKDLIYSWLTTPHRNLNNEIPINLILKGDGHLVDALLMQMLPKYPVWENND